MELGVWNVSGRCGRTESRMTWKIPACLDRMHSIGTNGKEP